MSLDYSYVYGVYGSLKSTTPDLIISCSPKPGGVWLDVGIVQTWPPGPGSWAY